MQDLLDHDILIMNKMKRRVLRRSQASGENTGEAVSVRSKVNKISEKEPRRGKRVCNFDTKYKGWEVASKAKAIALTSGSEMKCRIGAQSGLFDLLDVKLRSLEEDTRWMKKALLRCVEERALLMNEIAREFHFVKGCLDCLEDGDGPCGVASIVNSQKDISKIIGLSEVLHQNSKPSLVTRDIKVNLHASEDLAWSFKIAAGSGCYSV